MSEQKNFKPYFDAARKVVVSIETEKAAELITNENVVVLDVRQYEEYSQGAIPDAIHIPRGVLEESVETIIPVKETQVVVYCASGVRSVFAARTLAGLNYTNVVSMAGGFNAWKDEGRSWEEPEIGILTDETYTERFLSED